jgi:hypothetical protein
LRNGRASSRRRLHKRLAAGAHLMHVRSSLASLQKAGSMMGSPLARRLVLVTAVKLAALCVIYWLCFAPRSPEPIDPVAHIAGPSAPSPLGSR